MINVTIDNQKVGAEPGISLLEVCQGLGIKIPTLCYHKALPAYGACRLCLVEVEEWGRTRVQASCQYPAREGLIVRTNTESVIKTRRLMAELLLARCPESQQVKEVAAELGVTATRFPRKNEDCILCGMCVRVCVDRMKTGAIDLSGRGNRRKVGPAYDRKSPVCMACGACQIVCPTGAVMLDNVSMHTPLPILSEYEAGLGGRSSIYIPYVQAIPKVPVIDRETCAHFRKGKELDACRACEESCEAKAIDYDQQDELVDIDVGAVILSPGFELFHADRKKELGYDRYPNVVSSLQFERIMSASGIFSGQILRPSDKKHPKKIAFFQCVGSREVDHNYCSSVCCMYATKEAIIAKEHQPDLECHIFYIDIRAFGKGFEQYYERAKELGVKYTRCRPSAVKEIPATRNLAVSYFNEANEQVTEEFDLVVLSSGLTPPEAGKSLAEVFHIELNTHGFCKTGEFTPMETSRDGVFACGPFTEPKDIPETVMQACGAASKAMTLLVESRDTMTVRLEYPPEKEVSGQEPRIGVFVCHCGKNIGGVADVPSIRDYARTLANVVYAEDNLYTCSSDTQKKIKEMIKDHDLNRLVVASCTPRTHEPLFRNTCREAALNPYLFEMANIRDQNTWVHMHEPEKATQKAKDLVRIAVAKARMLEPLQNRSLTVEHDALVIGGGISGMTAALELANQKFTTHLVERSGELGGNMRHLFSLIDEAADPQKELKSMIGKVRKHPRIKLHLSSTVKTIEGSMGNFKTTLETPDGEVAFKHGTVIVATGAVEHKPSEYLYGQDPRVITQTQFEESMAEAAVHPDIAQAGSVVMIQCVGSREKEHPSCSRICCSTAIKNARRFKKLRPDARIYVLYRDIRAYGFNEEHYRKAREEGVIFLRYTDEDKPQVAHGNGKLNITLNDPLLNRKITLEADRLILSAGIVAEPGNEQLAQQLKVPLTQDKFFLEAHMKLRPVDFATEGVYLCGLAHSPKNIEESIIQACGAASRSATILAKSRVELDGIVSQVIDENCDGCAYCIDPCPYHALTLIEYMREGAIKKTVDRDLALCKGCGVCQATCPKAGIVINNFKLSQLLTMINAALEPPA